MTAATVDRGGAIEALAREALAQRDAALTRITRRSRSLEQRLDAQHVLAMAERLSLADLEMLGEATSLREAGLQAARDGDLDRGIELVAEAHDHCRDALLSEEALLSAETFQTAAEAYVRYRVGDQTGAEALLLSSIETCHALTAGYGYDFDLRLAPRPQHCACPCRRGRSDDALKLAALLVRVIEGDGGCWPWPSLAAAPERLFGEAAWMAMDQVVAEIALALRPPGGAALHAHAQREGWLDFDPSSRGFDRAHDFIAAYGALAAGDDARFLRYAASFFAEGGDTLAASCRRMDEDVRRIATQQTMCTR